MLLLTATTDKIDLITSAAATVDVHASFMDMTTADPPVVKGSTSGKQNTAISTAATTDVVAAPAASTVRNIKHLNIRNKSATTATDVTVRFNQNGTAYELAKETLAVGEELTFTEGVGWFHYINVSKEQYDKRVATEWTNSTTSFSDVTDLTCPVTSGKFYRFEAHIYHLTAATTTGAQFGVNGPTMTAIRVHELATITASATASTHATGFATALETNVITETTGPATEVIAIMSGYMNPSASGTFAIRGRSEVAASAVTVRVGSWLAVRELDN